MNECQPQIDCLSEAVQWYCAIRCKTIIFASLRFFLQVLALLKVYIIHSGTTNHPMKRRMGDLQFYVLFNSISVISGRCADDNEMLCAMEPRLRLRRYRLERG